jgi:hypothetical protein
MRIYKVLFLVLVFVLSAFCIIGCGKDDTVTNPPPGGGGGAFTLSGTITNYPWGSLIARAMINKFVPPDSFFVGTDTVDNNGELSITPVTPPTDFLVPISVPPSISVSDTTSRISVFGELRAYNFSNVLIGRIIRKNFDDTVVQGSFAVQYLFSTKAVSITGSDTAINILDTSVTVYSISAVSGWNALTLQLVIERPNFKQYDYKSGETAGASWRYEAVPTPLLPGRSFLKAN